MIYNLVYLLHLPHALRMADLAGTLFIKEASLYPVTKRNRCVSVPHTTRYPLSWPCLAKQIIFRLIFDLKEFLKWLKRRWISPGHKNWPFSLFPLQSKSLKLKVSPVIYVYKQKTSCAWNAKCSALHSLGLSGTGMAKSCATKDEFQLKTASKFCVQRGSSSSEHPSEPRSRTALNFRV